MTDFERAQQDVQTLENKPRNGDLLKLYALYKQSTVGDIQGDRPRGFDLVGGAKYDAWAELRGTVQHEAQSRYSALVATLKTQA